MQTLLRPIRSVIDYIRFFEIGLSQSPRRYVVILSALGLLSLLTTLFNPSPWGGVAWLAVPIFFVGLILKLLAALWSPARHSSYDFQPSQAFAREVQSLDVSDTDAKHGYRFVPPPPGVNGGVVTSRDFNVRCMANLDWDAPIVARSDGSHLDQIMNGIRRHRHAFRSHGLRTVLKKLFSGMALINENKIGIACNLHSGMTEVEVYRSNYLATWCSGDLAMQTIVEETSTGFKRIYSRPIDRAPFERTEAGLVLQPLSQSSARISAQIGVNVLCVTRDMVLLVAIQGSRTMHGQNQRVPTASGSMDWEDLARAKTFKELGHAAAVRELREEWGGNVQRQKAGKLSFSEFLPVGVFRVPDRSGKPEFAALGRLDWNEAELRADLKEVNEWESDQAGTGAAHEHRFPVPTFEAFAEAIATLLDTEGDIVDTTPLFGILVCLWDLLEANPDAIRRALGYETSSASV